MKKALIIFVRNPEKGKVKTRLAATVGDNAALHVYQKLLKHTLDVSGETNADKFIFYTGAVCADDIWNRERYYKLVQADGNLGEKMKAAFSEVLTRGYSQVVIIGSDCPQLTSTHLQTAFNDLHTHDVVIGPALDGGYYLLGMKRLHTTLFQNKAWSTGTVFEDTLHAIRESALSVGTLETLADVDVETDLPESWKAEIKTLFHLA
jgi:uncharacterized protein